MKVSKLALVCLVMLAVLAGCKSSRKATGEGGAEAKEGRALLEAVEEGALEFHTLSARLSADLKLQDGKELGSRVELKMVRDSMIQLSVQPFLGIEVFRLELTTDTVRLIDRMGKRYVAERYSGLLEQSPVDFNFYNLQALFVHQLFLPGEQEVEGVHYDQFHLEREGAITRLHARDRMDLRYCFEANSDEQLLSTLITEGNGRYSLLWKYLSLESQPSVSWLFPLQMQVAFRDEGIRKGGMDIRLSRLQWNKALNMDFSIPAKYKRITFADVLKMIGGNQ